VSSRARSRTSKIWLEKRAGPNWLAGRLAAAAVVVCGYGCVDLGPLAPRCCCCCCWYRRRLGKSSAVRGKMETNKDPNWPGSQTRAASCTYLYQPMITGHGVGSVGRGSAGAGNAEDTRVGPARRLQKAITQLAFRSVQRHFHNQGA
jgi:hypothetical protein